MLYIGFSSQNGARKSRSRDRYSPTFMQVCDINIVFFISLFVCECRSILVHQKRPTRTNTMVSI